MQLRFFSTLLLTALTTLGLYNTATAQESSILITGKIVERSSQQPLEFVTVMVTDKATQQPVTGTTTDIDGRFEMEVNSINVAVEVSFIGFATQTFENLQLANGQADLGTIQLSEDSQVLEEVVVRAEKSTTEFQLDKRVFNVGKDLSSTGASALEVLNNVPSVNVSIEGRISLRGSNGVQILINGKPSVIASDSGNALGTITADMIEKIEVITNPSAKYDAEGTSGIINIVLKKEERKGLNGSVTFNTGLPQNHSVGLSVNRRTEKFNLFSQLGAGYREMPVKSRNINQDLLNNTLIQSSGSEYRNEGFINFILGADYHINERNILTLSGNYAFEFEDQPSRFDFTALDNNGNTTATWYRTENTGADNPKYQYELQYKRSWPDDKDHLLLVSAVGNFFAKDQNSDFENVNIIGERAGGDQQTRTNFSESRNTFSIDYTKPFDDKWTLETGAQYVLNDVSNDFAVTDLQDGVWVPNEALTNIFEFHQNVLGLYTTGSYEGKKWGLKLGLRLENTDLNTLLVTTNEGNDRNFNNLFPTLHTSYKISDNLSLQAGYSKRIFRPRLWDLNPFFNIRNNFSIRTGNPNLLPELTDSYEVSSVYIYNQLSLNFGVYYRYTTDVVERVATFSNNVSTVMPMNIGTNRSTGIEINGKYTFTKWFSMNGDFNYNFFSRQGSLEATRFDFSADQWNTKLTAKLKLPADIDFEVTGQYQSPFQTVQSQVSEQIFADLGLRKKMWKGKGIISISVRDVFASRIEESELSQNTFYLYNWSQRGRFVTMGFSYGFGKGEAMEFSGQRRRF